MYLLNHNIHTPRNYTDSSKRFENDSLAGDKFFENRLNEKEGRFVDVTADVGIFSSFLGYGLAITTADINNANLDGDFQIGPKLKSSNLKKITLQCVWGYKQKTPLMCGS